MRFFLFLFLLAAGCASAQPTIHIQPIVPQLLTELVNNQSARWNDAPEWITVQLEGKGQLTDVQHIRYLGDNWIVISREELLKQQILNKKAIRQIGVLDPASKLSTEFRTEPEIAASWEQGRPVTAQLYFIGNVTHLLETLQEKASDVLVGVIHPEFIQIEISKSQASVVLELQQVMYLAPVISNRTALANTALTQNRLNLVHEAEPRGLGLKGEGVSVGVWDFGASGPHQDLNRSVTNLENEFFNAVGSQHTTIVAGAIAGDGLLRQEMIGMAPEAKVYVHNFFGDIPAEIRATRANFGIQVSNHSYNIGGAFQCFTPYSYSTASRQMDLLALEAPTLLNVFAAGNSAAACPFDFGTIVPGFQYAKNVLLVGNLQNSEETDPGSAKGPTADGRLGPEIMAKGASSFSPRRGIILPAPVDTYINAYGTSFSAPQISAIAALLQQAALEAGQGYPKASTLKALLCNTAKDLGPPGPDYEFGFGRVDAFKAISALQKKRYAEGTVTQGGFAEFSLEVPEGIAEMKVFLAWNDPAAQLPAAKVLVNDLDLSVTGALETILPLVLNPGNPSEHAAPGLDSLNNSEQVVWKNPAPGNYTIRVTGVDVPFGPQDFSLAWQLEAKGVRLTYPVGGETKFTNTETFVRWEAFIADSSVTVEFSLNGGGSWTVIGSAPAQQGQLPWNIPTNTFSNNALVRILVNGQQVAVSESFVIIGRPTLNAPVNCRDNIRFGWTNVSGAEAYIVSSLEAGVWKDIAEVNAPPFTFRNAVPGKEYFFSVRTKRGGVESLRSIAVKYSVRATDCNFTQKDIGIAEISPKGGRLSTSAAMGTEERVRVSIANYTSTKLGGIQVFHQVDGGAVYSVVLPDSIEGNATVQVEFPQTYDFSAAGTYAIRAWCSSPDDLFPVNDTAFQVLKQADAIVAGLPYTQDFEQVGELLLTRSDFGLDSFPEWDFISSRFGRLSTNTAEILAIQGRKAITVDNFADADTSGNELILNIDLEAHRDSLVYLDFSYRSRGELAGGDLVWIRGNPAQPWVQVFNLFNNAVPGGLVRQVSRLNLKKILSDAGQNFSNHTQVRFATSHTRSAITLTGNGGYTIDNIRLYNPGVDVALSSITLPQFVCLDSATNKGIVSIDVQVANNFPANIPAGTILLSYDYDGGIFTEALPLPIDAFKAVTYRISRPLTFEQLSSSNVDVYISLNTDRLPTNDSILRRSVAAITQLPNLPLETNFATGTSINFLGTGQNSSWAKGLPEKALIHHPADEGDIWTTNLSGPYAANELSYLYTGCLDFSQLTDKSQLAFHHIFDLEPGFDYHWMEVSGDGVIWDRFGVQGASIGAYNWYNNLIGNPKWEGSRPVWQVASHPIVPAILRSGLSKVVLRFVMQSDEAVELEGVGIDNFRIIKNAEVVIGADSVTATGNSNGSGKVSLRINDSTVAYIDDRGQNLGAVQLKMIPANQYQPTYKDRFLMKRRYVFKSENPVAAPIGLFVFLPNEEYLSYLDTDIGTKRMGEIGALIYHDMNVDERADNNHFSKGYSILGSDELAFWPYGAGYEVRMDLPFQEAEIFLSSHRPQENALPFVTLSDFFVVGSGNNRDVVVNWTSLKEQDALSFDVQLAADTSAFQTIGTVSATNAGEVMSSYQFTDSISTKNGTLYYRLKVNGVVDTFYTLLDSISFINTAVKELTGVGYQLSYLSNGILQLQYAGPLLPNASLGLFDSAGRQLAVLRQPLSEGNNRIIFTQLINAPAGMYFLLVESGREGFSGKFVKSD
jgi:hypothetical protein